MLREKRERRRIEGREDEYVVVFNLLLYKEQKQDRCANVFRSSTECDVSDAGYEVPIQDFNSHLF